MIKESYKVCKNCNREKYWYNFPVKKDKLTGQLFIDGIYCLSCVEKIAKIKVQIKLGRLMLKAEKNKMSDLREHLFECLKGVKDGTVTKEQAQTACLVAQTIINTAKVEIDFIKTVGGIKNSDFFQLEQSDIDVKKIAS